MKEKQFNYRKFYEKYLGVKLENYEAVHHIDFNRNNNDILNLVAMPKWLHNKYHMLYKIHIGKYFIDISLNNPEFGNSINKEYLKSLSKMIDVIEECKYYMEKRNSLIYNKYIDNGK